MQEVFFKVETEEAFFKRGKVLAKLADQEQPLPTSIVISFEDPLELLRTITGSRIDVLRIVKKSPGSITDIARHLQRDRSSVKRDVDQLEGLGLVTVESKPLPGHGRMKEVRAVAQSFRLEAVVA